MRKDPPSFVAVDNKANIKTPDGYTKGLPVSVNVKKIFVVLLIEFCEMQRRRLHYAEFPRTPSKNLERNAGNLYFTFVLFSRRSVSNLNVNPKANCVSLMSFGILGICQRTAIYRY